MPKEKNPHAVALSKLGAKKGGKARAAVLSAERRREIARRASLARWAKEKKKTEGSLTAARFVAELGVAGVVDGPWRKPLETRPLSLHHGTPLLARSLSGNSTG